MQAKVEQVDALVSIVVAAYNAETYIAETLRTILSQTYPAVEMIVVDDGSRDSTCQVVESFGEKVKLIRMANSGGPSMPRNVGAGHASGEYLVFFDADDLMCADRVETQLRFLQSNPQVQLVVSDYRNFTEQGDYTGTHFDTCVNLQQVTSLFRNATLSGPEAQDALLVENFGCTCACMFRRSVFEEAGGFDPELRVGEDYELIYRVARRGPIAVLPHVAFRRRLHAQNVSNRIEYNLQQKIRTRAKMLEAESNAGRARLLRLRLGELHADLFQLLSRESPGGALRQLRQAARLGSPVANMRTLKGLVKVLVTCVSPPQRRADA